MDTLFLVFIKPLQIVMAYVLHQTYALCGDHMVGIITLSIVVNLILLPLYHFAEKLQNRERAIQHKLRPKTEEIKAVFHGAERFMMMRTLYRQHKYHPIFALRSSVGFFIQVPFFIAAYLLLRNYEPFSGVSTLWFEDLNRVDGLLFGINVLPILMTLINLASGYVYTQKLTKNEKIQIWTISVLFLFLLYESPVSLVLYWTLNNVFSLVKNIVYFRFSDSNNIPYQKDQHSFDSIRESWRGFRQTQLSKIPKWNWKEMLHSDSMQIVLFVFCVERLIYLNFFNPIDIPKTVIIDGILGLLLMIPLLFLIKRIAILIAFLKCHTANQVAALVASCNTQWILPLFGSFLFIVFVVQANAYFQLNESLDKAHPDVSSAIAKSIGILFLLCGFGIRSFFRHSDKRQKQHVIRLSVIFVLNIFVIVLLFSWITDSYSITEPIYIKEALSGVLCLLLIILYYDKIQKALHRLAQFRAWLLERYLNFHPTFKIVLLLVLIYDLFVLVSEKSTPSVSRFYLWESLIILCFFFAIFLHAAQNYRFTPNIPLYIGSSSLLYYLILVAGPMMLYGSSLENIHLSKTQLILPHLVVFLQCFAISFLFYWLVSDNFKKLTIYVMHVLIVIGYLYSFFFLGNFGQLDAFKFRNASLLNVTIGTFAREVICIVLIGYIVWRLLPKFQKSILPLLCIIWIGISIYSAFQFISNRSIRQAPPLSSSEEFKKIHTYSTQQNIIVLMLDGFSGIEIDRLLLENPEVFSDYTGFTWYPNTLSVSTSTWGSIAALSAGHQFAPSAINQKRKSTFREEITNAYLLYPNSFMRHGYEVSYINPQYGDCNRMKEFVCIPVFDRFMQVHSESMAYKTINIVSLFRAAPFFLKKQIYDDGDWLVDEQQHIAEHTDKISHWEFLKNMPDNVIISDQPINTLKYFQFAIPHTPSVVNEKCEYTSYGDYRSEAKCALSYIAKFINTLKIEGIYGATKIILVSDHGLWHIKGTGRFGNEIQEKIRQIEKESKENRVSIPVIQPLMLVKDFQAKEDPLKTDFTFLSNADVAAMVCSAIHGCPGVIPDPTKVKIKNRRLTVSNAFINEKKEKNMIFSIPDQYEVFENIFEWKNWKKIN